jgi:hypothetical protein
MILERTQYAHEKDSRESQHDDENRDAHVVVSGRAVMKHGNSEIGQRVNEQDYSTGAALFKNEEYTASQERDEVESSSSHTPP